ncbi:TolC family protein [Pseudomonas sp. URMO17WK12:I2]|uniref:TolC family protein n=1 Tax=Pseudomonas sp. URMO17WK12:I2 TaxID=1261623 RepID=UPI000DAE7BA7|nr:adhesin transport system outer membrane protein [Pseudomonas sp. URMO17WK12:I2]
MHIACYRWSVGLALTLCLPASAMAMPLDQAVRNGLAIHPQVRAAVAEAARAETEVKIAKGGYYPSLSLSGGPQEFDIGETVYDVTVSQMLYDWGRVDSQVDSAKATQRQLSASAEVTREDAALDIVETYLDVLVAQRRIDAVRRHIRLLDDIRAMTEARGADGYSDRSEQDRAGLEIARAQEQLALEKGALLDAGNQFALLVGAPAQGLAEPRPQSMQRYLATRDMPRLITGSPLYQRALEDTNLAQAELRGTKAALLPQLNLEASATRREIGGRLQNDSMVNLRLRMDTIQGLSNFQRPTAAAQRLESASWGQDAIQRDIRRQLQSLFDIGDSLLWREQALAVQVRDSEQVGGLYREQFEVGRRDVIDLLTVQRERFEAERQLIVLQVERLRLEYRAAAQIGLLGPLLENGLNGS